MIKEKYAIGERDPSQRVAPEAKALMVGEKQSSTACQSHLHCDEEIRAPPERQVHEGILLERAFVEMVQGEQRVQDGAEKDGEHQGDGFPRRAIDIRVLTFASPAKLPSPAVETQGAHAGDRPLPAVTEITSVVASPLGI